MSKTAIGCLVALGLLVLVAVIGGVGVVGVYNGLVGDRQAVDAQWAQVENVYQRRADLVPNLVRTVQGAADFERQTLTQVVEARSRVGQLAAGPGVLEDPQRFAGYQAAQDQLGSALSRLLVVVERYPELKAVPAFQDLMSQLEGTENRIAVERRRFNEVARDYDVRVQRVPARWLIAVFGWSFPPRPYFQSAPGAEKAPEVHFGPSGGS